MSRLRFYSADLSNCENRLELHLTLIKWQHVLEIIWGGADKSLARPSSRCHRTELIVSLERGVCSCTELQVFSCYRGWKETSGDARDFNNIETRAVIMFFSCKARRRRKFTLFWQKHWGNIHHRMPPTKTGWLSFFTCDAPCPGRPKTMTTQKVIDQIHELILEDRRFSAK